MLLGILIVSFHSCFGVTACVSRFTAILRIRATLCGSVHRVSPAAGRGRIAWTTFDLGNIGLKGFLACNRLSRFPLDLHVTYIVCRSSSISLMSNGDQGVFPVADRLDNLSTTGKFVTFERFIVMCLTKVTRTRQANRPFSQAFDPVRLPVI